MNISLILIINACHPAPKFYEGYIFNTEKSPLSNLKVCVENKTTCTYTNSNGYFKLEKEKNSIQDLIVFSDNKPVDTIKTLWSQRGEKINYAFIEGKKDTLFINFKY